MSGISGITTARVELATATFTQTSTTTLLPTPNAGVDMSDAVTQLLTMSSRLSDQQMVTGKAQVQTAAAAREHASELRKEALARAVEAARKAREAQDNEGPFTFITDRLGVTGLIGLATFNWGLVAADMSAHEAGVAPNTGAIDLGAAVFGGPLAYLAVRGAEELAPEGLGQTAAAATLLGGPLGLALERAAAKLAPGELEKLDHLASIKDDDVRVANKVALTIALAALATTSTVLTGGTSAPAIVALVGIGISTTTQIAAQTGVLQKIAGEKAAGYIALGGAITGAVLTLGTSGYSLFSAAKSTTAIAKTIRALDAAQQITTGTHALVSGVRLLEAVDHQHDADLANVDAEAQRHALQRIEKMIDGILDDLREAKDSAQRSAETLHQTLKTHDQTLLQAGSMKA